MPLRLTTEMKFLVAKAKRLSEICDALRELDYQGLADAVDEEAQDLNEKIVKLIDKKRKSK